MRAPARARAVRPCFHGSEDAETSRCLYEGQTVRAATDAEAYALYICVTPALRPLHAVAVGLQFHDGCRAGRWDQLVADLLALNLDADLYDVAVDGMHTVAAMPCNCQRCTADAMAALKPRLLPVTNNSTSMNPLIRAKYDQTGRYRIRSR
jgi:hypothetical protein